MHREKLVVGQLLKKLAAGYGIRIYINVYTKSTRSHHLSMSYKF
jgi:hypothetical protein